MDKKELINKIDSIENIFKYSIKGGTSMFNKEHPNLLNEINNNTIEIQTYHKNKILIAKLVFLKKYRGILNNILDENNNIKIYDNKLNDFKIANINSAKKQWEQNKSELKIINELYNKKQTIKLLKKQYEKYLGKSGNRKLLKDNKKLYLSLYHHTKNLDELNNNLNKFSMRMYILINNINVFCNKHNRLKHWTFKNKEFKILCADCEHKYPTKAWFIKKYNDNWKFYYDNRKKYLEKLHTNSLTWYIKKYGEDLGKENYRKSVEIKVNSLVTLKKNRYSKISQELFWKIYEKLKNKDKTYFYELNQEYFIRIPEKYKHNKTIMIVDFIQNNKIIEYNGKFWHNKNKDDNRKKILNKMGYDVLYISSDDYNRNKKSSEIINKCINFLEC